MDCKVQEEAENLLDRILCRIAAYCYVLGKSVKTYNTLDSYAEITTVELIETISALTEKSLDEIDSINAKPGRNGIVVTAEFKNGITKTYLMKRGADGSSIEMTAQNSK